MAYGNNKVNILSGRFDVQKCFFLFDTWWILIVECLSSGAFSVCCGQAAGDWPGQHGPHRNLVETINRSPFGGKICC